MSDWRILRFDELAASDPSSFSIGPFGSRITKENYVPTGVPVVRGVNLARGIFVDSGFVYVTDQKANELYSSILLGGDLVFTHRGTIGQVSMIPRAGKFPRYILSSSQVKARLNTELAVPEFYYYWFRSPDGQRALLSNSSTVGVPGIASPLATIRSIGVPFPPKKIQAAIAQVLGALDDKIAVNDRIAETTRELGMALFAEAIRSGSDEHELSTLVALLTRGVAPKYSTDTADLLVLNQKCIRHGRVDVGPARRTLLDRAPKNKWLWPNDVLVNSTGMGTLGRVAIWNRDTPTTVDSHVTIVRFDPVKTDIRCAGFAMLQAQPYIERMGEGSTGQTELSRGKLGQIRLRLPRTASMVSLSPRLEDLEIRGEAARDESVALTEMRDALLPGLMSGEIRVRDAEKVVEDMT